MATSRQEVHERKATLKRTLRQRCDDGTLAAGTLAPSVRQIAREFEVSQSVATRVMQELIEDGLFYTVPRSGTFVGAPVRAGEARFLFLTHSLDAAPTPLVRMGFEDRIAALNGSVLTMSGSQMAEALADGSWDAIHSLSGVMEWGQTLPDHIWQEYPQIKRVRYATVEAEAWFSDSVAFDDVDGGRQATQHLLARHHRRIAFVGLHRLHTTASGEQVAEGPAWSFLREQGWQTSLQEAGLFDAKLAFSPDRAVDAYDEKDYARAAEILARDFCSAMSKVKVDAVITANDIVARALVIHLRQNRVASNRWPAIVSFDNDPSVGDGSITSLRLPWEEIGKVAADLVWDRSHGLGPAAPQHRLVKMRLIPRLTCASDWQASAHTFSNDHRVAVG